MQRYDHKSIEAKWRKKWIETDLYKTGEDQAKPKFYILDMFPYPSGAGLHVGHPKGYIATDIFARYKMMTGHNVLHPMGWDAFGLPAENFALKNKVHPRVSTDKNIDTFKKQLEKLGFTYDWDREINTTDPKFYKWTQWIFLEMFKRGLAYESNEPIIWCPSCQTGLAMEDLEDGKCERCGSEVERKPMRQWVLKITDYAQRMLDDLEKLPHWEPSIKEMQKNWIGRSEGAIIKFKVESGKLKVGEASTSSSKSLREGLESSRADEIFEVFTTRPDTLFGCTYVVLSPEHVLIGKLESGIRNWEEVEAYINNAKKKSDLERTELQKEKTGVRLDGVVAVNPVNGEEVPIFIADYVLAHYGTGAIMAVPAHDERDWEFAVKYDLPVVQVVKKNNVISRSYLMGGNNISDNDLITLGITILETNDKGHRKLEIPSEKLNDYKSLIKEKITPGFWNEIVGDEIFFIFKSKTGEIREIVLNKETSPEIEKLGAQYNDEPYLGQTSTWKWLAKNNTYTDLIVHHEDGIAINSGFLNGLETSEAKAKMIGWLVDKGLGAKRVNYKLQDWVFSRQRYWGEPIPIIHCEKCGTVGVPEKDLPVLLPEVDHYEPTGTGESPLANISEWVNTTCPHCGGPARRETNTMPQWAGSSWYYLRYIDPHNDQALIDKAKDKYWSPVDFYVGGAEHATRHLIYARFWHKFLFDIGVVNYDEPFTRLQHVGLIVAEDGRKMSKRWGNVINPDDIVEQFGADTMRAYEMFMGPFSQSCAWSTSSMVGTRRFLERVWKLGQTVIARSEATRQSRDMYDNVGIATNYPPQPPLGKGGIDSLLHKTIKKVGEDIEQFKFNTAVSAMMILVNEMEKSEYGIRNLELAIRILAPFAPHMCEELWELLGHTDSIFKQPWPRYDPELIKDDMITLIISINGKVREKIEAAADISEIEAIESALGNEKVKKWIEGKRIIKKIYVPGKLVNLVVE